MSNRKRINVSINPLHYQELQRICKDYKFANICEICTGLLSVFIQTVCRAEQEAPKKKKSNSEMIQEMFAELEQWEPTPDPAIMYKRHNRRTAGTAATTDAAAGRADPDEPADEKQNDLDGLTVHDETEDEDGDTDTRGAFF